MKKILFIASAILILLSGCENFLDSELLTEKTTANFPETEKDAQEMVTAIYAHLLFESPETSSQYYIAQLAGDDCLGGNLSYSNNCATNFLMYSGNLIHLPASGTVATPLSTVPTMPSTQWRM